MLRKSLAIMSITSLALCSCGGRSAEAARSDPPQVSTGLGAHGEIAAPAACPTRATRKFAKTRFIVNAGLATGAFKRYIYDPYRKNAFKKGAPGQKKAIAKATVAGVFVLDQLRRAKKNVMADPTLCKALAGPIAKLTAVATALVAKMKRGQIDPADIGALSSQVEGFRKTAGGAGAAFKDRAPPASAVGG